MISIDDLLREVSPENPCGDDLEYAPDFVAMEQASRGKAEQQVGDSIVPAEEPDWRTVKGKALDLLKESKDLRVAVYLTRAMVPTDGLVGLCDGLQLVEGLIERYWDDFHPKLDPDDNNDPTTRVNTLLNLCGQETMLQPVREVELVSAKGIGRFSFRDILIAEGKLPAPAPAETPLPGLAEIEAAFMDCDLEELQEKAEAAKGSIGLVESIESTLMDKVGPTQAVGFSPVTELLKELSEILSAELVRRGVGVPEDEAGGGRQPVTGEVSTREDVIRVLDKVCEYFRRNEPSSPVPLLLGRAKKLVSKEFMEIVRDLAPSGVQEVEKIRGPESE
ncbi:MAG: type VI secretion system protein TssA [Gemmatimonadetes bacterium]|nr:type VI secretion system protein TssA [Gemmatimonadota bacterium]